MGITVDGKGKLLCSDQHGKIYRVTISEDPDKPATVALLDIPLQATHGLLWHHGVLWVCVNEGPSQSGVWRVTDSNGDGDLFSYDADMEWDFGMPWYRPCRHFGGCESGATRQMKCGKRPHSR